MVRAMDDIRSAFPLPVKLIDEFDRGSNRDGFSTQRAVCAAILHFLRMAPADQVACLKRLDVRFPPEPQEQSRKRAGHRTGGQSRRAGQGRIVVTNKMMRLQIPPPDKQRTIG